VLQEFHAIRTAWDLALVPGPEKIQLIGNVRISFPDGLCRYTADYGQWLDIGRYDSPSRHDGASSDRHAGKYR
jgi:hypothetical protein